jgi:hypothetical protein
MVPDTLGYDASKTKLPGVMYSARSDDIYMYNAYIYLYILAGCPAYMSNHIIIFSLKL